MLRRRRGYLVHRRHCIEGNEGDGRRLETSYLIKDFLFFSLLFSLRSNPN